MSISLRNRDFLKIADFNQEELDYLLNLAARLKKLRGREKNLSISRGKT